MKPTKDNFSEQANLYASCRPTYPADLFNYLLELCPVRDCVWDVGTGNGQVAWTLAENFARVEATDISQAQLEKAKTASNIRYHCVRAEQTDFPEQHFNLITVGQALHWFDFTPFFEEVKRTAVPGAIFAAWGYGLLRINPELDARIDHFYKNVAGPFWDTERRHVEQAYQSIAIPFSEMDTPEFFSRYEWSIPQLEGYLNTWSSVRKYIKAKNENPVGSFVKELRRMWPEGEKRSVRFPIFMRVGRID